MPFEGSLWGMIVRQKESFVDYDMLCFFCQAEVNLYLISLTSSAQSPGELLVTPLLFASTAMWLSYIQLEVCQGLSLLNYILYGILDLFNMLVMTNSKTDVI